jgi:dienelactone hydrolase
MKRIPVLAQALTAVAVTVFSAPSMAQLPPGIDMAAVNTTLPEEGAPKAVPGEYAVSSGLAYGNPALKVFRPAQLNNFPKRDKLPVVIWGNGGCAIDGPRYAGFLETIASHGFLVITTAATPGAAAPAPAPAQPGAPGAPGGGRRSATAADLKAGIDWAEAENARDGSELAGKIQTSKVAVMGQSCGGRLSIELGADPRVTTIGVFNAGIKPNDFPMLAKLHGPTLFINGHERDFMMADSKASFDAIATLPAFYGARHGAGHTATAYHVGGGEFANVATNWVLWQFKNKSKARKMFVGKSCTLCKDANWDAEGKRLK